MCTFYSDLLQPSAKRAEYLRRYGIDQCICQACKEGPASDARPANLLKPITPFKKDDAQKQLKQLIADLEREGLESAHLYGKAISMLVESYLVEKRIDKVNEMMGWVKAVATFHPDQFANLPLSR